MNGVGHRSFKLKMGAGDPAEARKASIAQLDHVEQLMQRAGLLQ